MNEGLLKVQESVRIRLGDNRDILSASDAVFQPENQEEARVIIYESDYLRDYLEEFGSLLGMGDPKFVSVTEPGRQTTFRYEATGSQSIVVTREHRGIDQILKDLTEAAS